MPKRRGNVKEGEPRDLGVGRHRFRFRLQYPLPAVTIRIMKKFRSLCAFLLILLFVVSPLAAQKAGKNTGSSGGSGGAGTSAPTAPSSASGSGSSLPAAPASSGTTVPVPVAGSTATGVPAPTFGPPFQGTPEQELAYYLNLNRQETRLADYRDSDETVRLKIQQLRYINASRSKNGLGPLELDILASRVANMQCVEAAKNRFSGHWNMRGEKPYHRYAFAGGVDHVSENAASYSSSAAIQAGSEPDLMRQLHDMFMAERPPEDGHRQNVLGRHHTHIGIGCARSGGEFRYYEEFVDRYIEFVNVPRSLKPGEQGSLTGRPGRQGYHIYAFVAYYETFPQPMSAAQIERMGSYPDYTSSTALMVWPHQFTADASGAVTIQLSFKQRGLYYVQVYLDTRPYSGSGSMTTQGKIQGSGVVIRVE